MTAAEDTGHILGGALAVVFALAFLIAPGVMIVREEFRLRRTRREAGTVIPLDRGTLAFGAIMLASGVAVIVTRLVP